MGTQSEQPRTEFDIVENKSDNNQRLIAIGAILGSVGLAIQHIIIGSHLHGWPQVSATAAASLGWLIFGVGAIRNYRLGKSPEGQQYFSRVKRDERLLSIRARAFAFGFGAMMAVQVVLLILWVFFGSFDSEVLSVPVAAPTTIAAGVAAAVLRHQQLMRR